ncbi:MAG: S8 family serine peptidase, partial [Cytophagales bacterium]
MKGIKEEGIFFFNSVRFLVTVLLLNIYSSVYSQEYFVVEFTEKDSCELYSPCLSQTTYQNREALKISKYQYSDLPVKAEFLKGLKAFDVEILGTLKWLNACWIKADSSEITQILSLNYVKKISSIQKYKKIIASLDTQLIVSDQKLQLIGESCLRKKGLNGDGVIIGVVDAGFAGFRSANYLKNSRKKNKVIHTRDFLNQEKDVFSSSIGNDDHGLTVLKNLVGISKKRKFGLAPEAKLVLARTENANKEFRMEELLWAKSLEWFDSLGVRLVNSSLGYSIGFDDPKDNYQISDLDGQSTIVTRAAKIATEEKGMIIVTSAGNEGNKNEWRILTAPADAKWAISVGALNTNFTKAGFSSIGPDFLAYVKPDVCAISGNGTSFSAPIITGLIACMLQLNPKLTLQEIFMFLEQSGHLFPFPNNYVGYGMPDACKIIELMEDG